MIPLTRKELESHENVKECCICKIRFLKIKIIEKSVIIVITQANKEVRHTVFVISNLICLMKSLQFFIGGLIRITILSLKNFQTSLKDSLNVSGKTKKV